MKKILIFILPLISILSCSSIKMETDQTKAIPVIVYSKSPCFGNCPIYNMTIYNSGLIKYNGVKFTEKMGKFEKTLDSKTYTELIKLFKTNRFWRFDDDYGMDLVDAATITLSYSENGKTKTVKGKSKFPDKLKELYAKLDEIEKSKDGWIQLEKAEKIIKPEEIIDNQIIIKSGEGMILASWLQEYKPYGVRLMRKIAGTDDMWLIRYDKELISPEEMLKKIKADKFIAEAEFNTKTSEREN